MPLDPGTTLGPYAVTAKIGEGGMGEVYRARDTKLDRDVALKVLPEAFTQDPDRLARFEREAKVLASLNHPNIAAIYGLEESEGIRALVLELVEGPTLADRIKQGPIALDEALPIAKQIAEALEAAHEAGVIHRDLKPANIKVRDDGTVKVLDFGLAKALDPSPTGDPSQSPTLTAAATQMGVIMGTAAYMSPEQAAGKPVDKRGDIWAFGVVLFEMLTGQRLFTGETVSHVLGAVLQVEPKWDTLPPSTSLRRLLRRCLEKERKHRLRDVGDAVAELDEALAASPTDGLDVDVASRRPDWRHALPLVAVTALVVGMATGLVGWSLRPDPGPPSLVRLTVTLPVSDELSFFGSRPGAAISADGETLVYTATRDGVRQIYRRPLNQLDATPIPRTEGAGSPFLSPDGEWLGFEVDDELKRVSLAGGPLATLYDGPLQPTDASWGTNDTIVFGVNTDGNPIIGVPATGGVSEPVTTLEEGELDHRHPALLPGGTALLFTVASQSAGDRIAVQLLNSAERRFLLEGSGPRYISSGHMVFARDNALWAVPFDADQLEVTGAPVPVLEGVEIISGFGQFSAAQNGSLIYIPADETVDPRQLVWVDRGGNEELLAAEPRPYRAVRLSPDGRRVVAEVSEPDNVDLVVYDLARNTPTRLTSDPTLDIFPVWTPDGTRIVFASTRNGVRNLYWKAADGSGAVERLSTDISNQFPSSFSPDGQTLLFAAFRDTFDIATLSMDGDQTVDWLLEGDYHELSPEVSPDGRWLAYSSSESGQGEVYVRRFPNVDEERWQVSADGGVFPMWGPDGRELFYVQGTNALMAVSVDTDTNFNPGNAALVFEGPYRGGPSGGARARPYDISPDGRRFLMIKETTDSPDLSQLIVVLNWHEELKRLVPVD